MFFKFYQILMNSIFLFFCKKLQWLKDVKWTQMLFLENDFVQTFFGSEEA